MKLIRDKLALTPYPENPNSTVLIVDKPTQRTLALHKILEEAHEVFHAKNIGAMIEEVGDLLDVIDLILELNEIRPDEVKEARIYKKLHKGGFTQGFVLI